MHAAPLNISPKEPLKAIAEAEVRHGSSRLVDDEFRHATWVCVIEVFFFGSTLVCFHRFQKTPWVSLKAKGTYSQFSREKKGIHDLKHPLPGNYVNQPLIFSSVLRGSGYLVTGYICRFIMVYNPRIWVHITHLL